MFVDIIKYTDFDGNPQEEEVRLNLTKLECKELDLKYESEGGIFQHLKNCIGDKKGNDIPQKPMYDFLKEVVSLAYGKKSEDGRRFIKQDRNGNSLAYEFMDSSAYFSLMESLLSGERDIEKFILSVFPEVPEEDRKKAESNVKKELGV